MKAKHFVQALDHQGIVAAIHEAEQATSGEIRVFISHRANVADAVQRARERFRKLGMQKTAERHGVLIYFAPEARKFAVVGDQAIHERVGGDDFWQGIIGEVMQPLLAQEKYTEAIIAAVGAIGRELSAHFPVGAGGHVDELPDDVQEEGPEGD